MLCSCHHCLQRCVAEHVIQLAISMFVTQKHRGASIGGLAEIDTNSFVYSILNTEHRNMFTSYKPPITTTTVAGTITVRGYFSSMQT